MWILTWIAALNHKVPNNSMEYSVVIIPTTCELGKIAACFGCVFPVEFNRYIAHSEVRMRFISYFRGYALVNKSKSTAI